MSSEKLEQQSDKLFTVVYDWKTDPEAIDKYGEPVILEETSTRAKKHKLGKLRIDLIPPEITLALAEGFELGVNKGYGERNWEQGLLFCSESLAAAKRHILKWELGEDMNIETSKDGKPLKLHHLKCALINLAMIITQIERGNSEKLDDRRRFPE